MVLFEVFDKATKMQASEKASRMFTTANSAVKQYGDDIWCIVCDTFWCDVPFTLIEAVDAVRKELPFSRSTATSYTRAALQSAMDQDEPHIKRVTGRHYILPSA
jgi:hypothetical protein